MASILPNGGTCEKYEDFFVLHPVLNKNLSRFLKIHFHLPGIRFGSRLLNREKKRFEIFWEGGFGGKGFWSDPP
jgi:hypothetical protein